MPPAVENPQAGAGRPLPKKEADLFRNVVKHYETKQYKKALKQADKVLEKFPNHGETLAMKGLTLNGMSKREEAHGFVKKGLMNDMKSHVCWHVYGLLYRADQNYNEAIKAYKQALRIEPENLQILRDLSMLQIQMRDLDGFVVTRNTLLNLKPNAKINWMAFALSKHMIGDLEGAVNVIDIYLGTLTEGSAELGRSYESSELAMYRNSLLAEQPDNYAKALEHLGVCEGIVVDRGAWLMKRAEYQLFLRDFAEAEKTIGLMFDRGMTDDFRVQSLNMCIVLELDDVELCQEALRLKGTNSLATMVPLSADQKAKLRQHYQTTLAAAYPKSYAIQRIPVYLMEGDELKAALDRICRKELPRGVPSLCAELTSFVLTEKNGRLVKPQDPVDIKSHPTYQMIVSLVDGYISSLEACSKLSPSDDSEGESPATTLWTWFLRASLHELVAEYSKAIELTDKCLEHTPTVVDVYELKARLLKASGDIKSAVDALDKGRELDKQDRYINNMTTKYMLQADMEKDAYERIALFTRHEGQVEQNLFDMQSSWFELELADSLRSRKLLGRSLKKYAAIVKHFDDFNEDQFDFHGYCLRKVTLRSYVEVLRFEDELFGLEYYRRAADGIISIYLHLSDNPTSEEQGEPDYSKMTAAERKKAKSIARKQKKKESDKKDATQKGKDAENGDKKNAPKASGKLSFVDEDPEGVELLKKNPLEEAQKYATILKSYAPNRLQIWMLQYDIAIRRKKVLMALQSLRKAHSIDPDSSELFTRIIDFATRVDGYTDLPAAAQTILKEEFPILIQQKSVGDFVQDCIATKLGDSLLELPMRTALAKAMVDTKVGSAAEAAKVITNGGLACRNVTIESVLQAAETLKAISATDALKQWVSAAKEKFPLIKFSS